MLRYAYRLVKCGDLAQDLVQEAFLRLHDRFETIREPRPWLYRITHNLAMSHHRKANRLVPLESDSSDTPAYDPVDTEPLPDEHIERMEAVGQTRLCLDALDERSRRLVQLKFNDGLSYKEIAAEMDLSVGNVGFILHHALKQLASDLERAGVNL